HLHELDILEPAADGDLDSLAVPVPLHENAGILAGVSQAATRRNAEHRRLVRMRMLRRLSILAAAVVLVGSATAAPSLDREMREVSRLRGLSFVHSVREKTIDRSQLRPLIREQLSREIPYSIDDYIRVLKALQLIDASTTDVEGKMFDLYDAQVLAFYAPTSHTYFAIRQLPEALAGVPDSSALRESVVLHELTHALQDQRFDATARDKALQRDTDGELAYHALLE